MCFWIFLEIALGDGPINSRIRDNSIWEKLYLNYLELCWVPFALIDVSHPEEDMNPNSILDAVFSKMYHKQRKMYKRDFYSWIEM